MSKSNPPEELDGRRLRSERSKQAIIDASLALMEEGNLIPTAQQISDQAGVGIRSFFRHFEDMETLFATIDEQTRESTEALFLGGDRDAYRGGVRHRPCSAFKHLRNRSLSYSRRASTATSAVCAAPIGFLMRIA